MNRTAARRSNKMNVLFTGLLFLVFVLCALFTVLKMCIRDSHIEGKCTRVLQHFEERVSQLRALGHVE